MTDEERHQLARKFIRHVVAEFNHIAIERANKGRVYGKIYGITHFCKRAIEHAIKECEKTDPRDMTPEEFEAELRVLMLEEQAKDAMSEDE